MLLRLKRSIKGKCGDSLSWWTVSEVTHSEHLFFYAVKVYLVFTYIRSTLRNGRRNLKWASREEEDFCLWGFNPGSVLPLIRGKPESHLLPWNKGAHGPRLGMCGVLGKTEALPVSALPSPSLLKEITPFAKRKLTLTLSSSIRG